MAKKTYIGVNGVAKNVKNVYIGINGVAKKVKKIYIGVNGVAKECYSSAVLPTIVSWSSGSDAEIVAMVQAADNGAINLSDYWSVNDERQMVLSSISATGGWEAHASQTVTFVLMDTNKYTLTTPTTSGRTTCSFAVGMKNSLAETGKTTASAWNNSGRRGWLNSSFLNAIPSTIVSIFKQFKTPSINSYRGSTIIYTDDYFALWAEKEMSGKRTYSNNNEANALSAIAYYTTSSNRIKKNGGNDSTQSSGNWWWLRSLSYNSSSKICSVITNGQNGEYDATNSGGISPFGCI